MPLRNGTTKAKDARAAKGKSEEGTVSKNTLSNPTVQRAYVLKTSPKSNTTNTCSSLYFRPEGFPQIPYVIYPPPLQEPISTLAEVQGGLSSRISIINGDELPRHDKSLVSTVPTAKRTKVYVKAKKPPRPPERMAGALKVLAALQYRERKNLLSRARTLRKREVFIAIQNKSIFDRDPDEVKLMEVHENCRHKKNIRTKERAAELKDQIASILCKPPKARNELERSFLERALTSKKKKNERDRHRRENQKEEKTRKIYRCPPSDSIPPSSAELQVSFKKRNASENQNPHAGIVRTKGSSEVPHSHQLNRNSGWNIDHVPFSHCGATHPPASRIANSNTFIGTSNLKSWVQAGQADPALLSAAPPWSSYQLSGNAPFFNSFEEAILPPLPHQFACCRPMSGVFDHSIENSYELTSEGPWCLPTALASLSPTLIPTNGQQFHPALRVLAPHDQAPLQLKSPPEGQFLIDLPLPSTRIRHDVVSQLYTDLAGAMSGAQEIRDQENSNNTAVEHPFLYNTAEYSPHFDADSTELIAAWNAYRSSTLSTRLNEDVKAYNGAEVSDEMYEEETIASCEWENFP